MREVTVQLREEKINLPLLHEELKQEYSDFRGLVLRGTELTIMLDGPTTQAEINATIAQHDHTQESRDELALRQEGKTIEALELLITTEADPILVLEARITRIEIFLKIGLE